MKNRLLLIVPTLLMLSTFSDVTEANATTDEPLSVVVLQTDADATIIESTLESTISESPPPEITTPVATVPETTEPVTTTPVTAIPETTEPVTTTPVAAIPETTEPVTTTPVATVPETAEPVTTTPVTTIPETAEPVPTTPVTTIPETAEPVTTTPVTTIPETAEPVPTTPVTIISETTEPVTTTPVTIISETTDLETNLTEETALKSDLTTETINTFSAALAATTGPSELITRVDTVQKVISLTISDITSQTNLTAILNNLASVGVKATFFVDATANPAFIAQIAAAGHEIGNQSYQHIDTTQLTTAQLTSEVNQMDNIIQNNAGTTSKPYFRAPYGITNTNVLNTVGSLGYTYTIGWTKDTRDWTGTLTSSQVSSAVTSNLSPGAIYLLHANPSASTTPAALLSIIATAKANGYQFATIDGLLSLEDIIIEDPNAAPSKVITQVATTEKAVALTFDDGNSSENIQAILEELDAYGIKATFFLDGDTDPALITQIAAAGHEIGNHTYSHNYSSLLDVSEFKTELNLMDSIIQDATGESSKPYFRAPYGDYNASVLQAAGSLGYAYTIGWTVDTRDWSGISASSIASKVTSAVAPGSIYLLHASNEAPNTPAALSTIISSILAKGYQFKTVSGLLASGGVVPPVDPTADPSELITKVTTQQKAVSLTISDVTNQANLTAILKNLATVGVKATFFVDSTADTAFIEQIVAAGHEIGNQSFQHVDATKLTTTQLATQITQMDSIIVNATGESAKPYFRAPYGITNASVLATAGSLGYSYTIGWTNDTRDWTGTLSAAQLSTNVINSLAPGSIYLFHANSLATTTPAALLSIVSSAQSNGYTFKTISGLLALGGILPEEPVVPVEPSDFVIPNLEEFLGVSNPVITIGDVTDRYGQQSTADPFIMYDNGTYYMFFEVIGGVNPNTGDSADEVAYAYSNDLTNWTYGQVVLGEENNGTRAAYPYVFEYESDYYMIPDRTDDIKAYVATDFPLEWEYYSTLLDGTFVDSNVFEVGGVWYLTTSEYPYDSISLYFNDSGDWRNDNWELHPAGLIIEEDLFERGYRGAGTPFVYEDYVVMPVQVTPTDTGVYGEYTDWYKLSDLSTTTVSVENLGRALTPTYDGSWTSERIHHISHAPYGDGYIYAVDGYAYYDNPEGIVGEYTIGLFTDYTEKG